MVDRERQELYRIIWNLANKLRGSVDGWDFKNYILGFLFYRYISEDFERYIEEFHGNCRETYIKSRSSDSAFKTLRRESKKAKGYFIQHKHLFSSMLNEVNGGPKSIDNLNERLNKAFREIEGTAKDPEKFAGLFSMIDLNDSALGKEVKHKNRKLKDILIEIGDLNIKTKEADLFGDAYEYLIGMYASSAGKSGGEFYTPPEVSELLAHLVVCGRQEPIENVYDPTCGSGSLLLKCRKIFKNNSDLKFFGQEINLTTYNLCRMNMFLHGVNYNNFDIKHGDTLTNDLFKDKKFNAIVSNPPYSIRWEGKDNPQLRADERFCKAGALAPKNKADLAFIQHSLHHLGENGVAAIVCFPGILFREHAEREIRKYLIDNNYIDAIIQLTDRLFYATGIAVCIMVLKKNKSKKQDVLFIDATTLFSKATNRNRLCPEHIEQIIQIYQDRKDVEDFAKLVSNEEIKEKEYILSVDSYVVKQQSQEQVDISALNEEIQIRTTKINKLRQDIDDLVQQLKNLQNNGG